MPFPVSEARRCRSSIGRRSLVADPAGNRDHGATRRPRSSASGVRARPIGAHPCVARVPDPDLTRVERRGPGRPSPALPMFSYRGRQGATWLSRPAAGARDAHLERGRRRHVESRLALSAAVPRAEDKPDGTRSSAASACPPCRSSPAAHQSRRGTESLARPARTGASFVPSASSVTRSAPRARCRPTASRRARMASSARHSRQRPDLISERFSTDEAGG